jgi:hypothetical protein
MTQFPQIHSNGTSGKVLLEEHQTALTAINAAIDAVRDATCHGRDYYTISPSAAETAFAEKQARLVALKKIKDELEAIVINIYNQTAK